MSFGFTERLARLQLSIGRKRQFEGRRNNSTQIGCLLSIGRADLVPVLSFAETVQEEKESQA